MDRIVPNYVVGFVYGALVESFSCEQNARMMAMQSASNSARDMLAELDILYTVPDRQRLHRRLQR